MGTSGGILALFQLAGTSSFEEIGDGLGDMLTSSIASTGCFDVVDREEVAAIKQDMESLGKNYQVQEVDKLISASITYIGFDTDSTNTEVS